jgi:hypothetical protein
MIMPTTTQVFNTATMPGAKALTRKTVLGVAAGAIALTASIAFGSHAGLFSFNGKTPAAVVAPRQALFTAQTFPSVPEAPATAQSEIKENRDYEKYMVNGYIEAF